MYEEEPECRDEILDYCFHLIDGCDKAYFYMYGDDDYELFRLSEGQEKEFQYAWRRFDRASLIDMPPEMEFKEPPQECIEMEKHLERMERIRKHFANITKEEFEKNMEKIT